MLFSIVVPIYKVEKYLPTCIDSLISQTYSNIEIILVDDGSPDNCGKICDEYAEKDERIRAIHQKNGGVSSARLAGAEAASGDYICCVDGDDWVSPDYIKKFAMEASKAEYDIICVGKIVYKSNKQEEKPLPFRYGSYDQTEIVNEFFPMLIQSSKATYFPASLWAKAIKRDLYLPMQQLVDSQIKIGEDGACVIPCVYRAQSISIMPDCLYYYRFNEESMTKNKKAFPWEGPRLIAEHLMRQIDFTRFDFQEQMYRKTAHELFSVVVSQFNRKEAYMAIKEDILLNLDIPIYKQAINNAVFTDIRGKTMVFAMKYKKFWLIWLWNKIKGII